MEFITVYSLRLGSRWFYYKDKALRDKKYDETPRVHCPYKYEFQSPVIDGVAYLPLEEIELVTTEHTAP